jgi:2-polyprenyl-6-methoxyphenol hydroxylase-like FAD-dependent oxidoreductase
VLVVGGSLVGMSAALMLAHHGIPALVVEHHRGTAIHPRAAQISQRTMEIFRSVGLEPVIRRRSADQFVQDGAIMAVETLAGRELAWFIANLNEGVRDVSPTERVFVSQSLLEPLLKSRAAELGADLHFGTDLISFDQDADGVTAVLKERDSGNTRTVRATFMIAADGAHSGVRKRLGIGVSGRGTFSRSVTIYFRGDVAPLLAGRNLSVIYVSNSSLRGFFRIEKPFDRGFLAVNATGDPASPVTDVATGITSGRCLELVRLALGTDDVAITIENVMPWEAAAHVADRFADGRVFIAGDAAHVMPPNGGFGGNTGVQDAQNLAWKMAMVLNGTADSALLDTYESERRPVASFTVEQAYSRYVTRTAPYLSADGIQPLADDLNVELGYGYRSAAVIPEAGDDGAPLHQNPRGSAARPGTRAPHVWLERQGQRISTLDLFGRRFILLTLADGVRWREGADRVTRELGVPLDVYEVGSGHLIDPSGDFAAAYGLKAGGCVVVRPDGFVGWRASGDKSDASDDLTRALSAMLRRPEAGQRANT